MSEKQLFEISKIYIKDVSCEAPMSPEAFKKAWEPDINLNIGNASKSLEEGFFEVCITLTVTAKLEDKTVYLIEVQQAGIFKVQGFEKSQIGAILGAAAPNILFPYARELVASLSQKLGFPPLTLNPIDFTVLYQQHLQAQAKAQKEKEQGAEQTEH